MLIVDTRNEDSVTKKLDKLAIPYEQRKLEVGDLYFEDKDMIIERKKIGDFKNSVYSGRIFVQAQDMVNNYKYPFIIIIGNIKELRFMKSGFKQSFTLDAYFGSIARLCSIGVGVLCVDNTNQYVNLAKKLSEKIEDGKEVTKIKKLNSKENTDLAILGSLPNISKKRAKQILGDFCVKLALTNKNGEIVNIEEIAKIEGIGNSIIQNLEGYFV